MPGTSPEHLAFSTPSLLKAFSNETEEAWHRRIRGMSEPHRELIDGGITVVNETEIANSRIGRNAVLAHEERHSWNQLLATDKFARTTRPMERIKDEIIA
jgi:hypothetical protein